MQRNQRRSGIPVSPGRPAGASGHPVRLRPVLSFAEATFLAPPFLLWTAVALRVLVFFCLEPFNRDWHFGVVLEIVEQGELPAANVTDQSYHPPLYHLLAAGLFALSHRPKVVQLLSLLFSVLTLFVAERLLMRTALIRPAGSRKYYFAFVCFYPQLLLYGLYLSNDGLAVFWGALATLLLWRYVNQPTPGLVSALAVVCGLGLSTKFSFLAFLGTLPFVIGYVAYLTGSKARRWSRACGMAGLFVLITLLLGGYKFVENVYHFGTPIVSNLDGGYAWVDEQAAGRNGLWSYLGFDPLRLIRDPSGESRRSYGELLYGTFWYEYLPMSEFLADQRYPLLGGAILLVGAVPAFVAALGAFRLVAGAVAHFRRPRPGSPTWTRRTTIYAMSGVLIAHVAILVGVELRHHVWSVMHARLLLPAFLSFLFLFNEGARTLRARRHRFLSWVQYASMAALVALFFVQLGVDVLASVREYWLSASCWERYTIFWS